MRTLFLGLSLVLASAIFAEAQTPVIPTTYRVTRTQGTNVVVHTFPKSSMACDLAVAVPVAGGLRITDPERDTRDCQATGTTVAPIFAGMLREIEYSFTIAGQHNAIDGYGPESVAVRITLPRIPQIPGAPQAPRITPPATQGAAVLGTVLERGSAFGLDVATTSLDGVPNFPFYFGASTLTTPSYGVTKGDRFYLTFWRE